MTSAEMQIQVFQNIKTKLPAHLSMVDEIASVLELSTDSAYRRIRGEKLLSLEEVYRLCTHFKLSLDQLLHLQSDAYLFTGSFIQPTSFRFDQYLKGVAQHMKYMSGFKDRKIFYLCKDIPIFHHFHFREVAAFKHYVWMKGIFNSPEFARKKFSLKDYPDELFELGQRGLDIYNGIDSIEIWTLESINSTIHQIEYYHESGLFEHEEEVMMMYDAIDKLVMHFDRQAGLGYKFRAGEDSASNTASFQMYLNEMIIGDNSVLAILDGVKMSFIIHTVVNIMNTTDTRFCDNMYESMQNIIRRSTLISSVSERERSRFIKVLRHRIAARKMKNSG